MPPDKIVLMLFRRQATGIRRAFSSGRSHRTHWHGNTLPGATDSEGKGESGIPQGSGHLILVVAGVAVVAAGMVVNVFFDGATIGAVVLLAVSWAEMFSPAVAPAMMPFVILAALILPLLIMGSTTVITACPGTS